LRQRQRKLGARLGVAQRNGIAQRRRGRLEAALAQIGHAQRGAQISLAGRVGHGVFGLGQRISGGVGRSQGCAGALPPVIAAGSERGQGNRPAR
jgi:hypothetical protein